MGVRGTLGPWVCSLVLLSAGWAGAQEAETGLLYYAVENRDLRRVSARGTTGATGTLFSNLILAPNTRYRIHVLQAETLDVGWVDFTTPENGQNFQIPNVTLGLPSSHDTDGDGLHDQGEAILNTDPRAEDTDGDGVSDSAEARAGTNALDGTEAVTGLIASADLSGNVVDVAATNEIVAVAAGNFGVTVFNVFNGMNPRAIAQVGTDDARRVAASGTLIAVADGGGGLKIIDVSDPPAARVVHSLTQFLLGGPATAVSVIGQLGFVGTSTGELSSVDLTTGTVLDRVRVGAGIRDLFVAGDSLYVLDRTRLLVYAYLEPGLPQVGAAPTPVVVRDQQRVFAGGDFAYVTHFNGVHVADVSDPTQPTFVSTSGTTSFGWEQLVLDGSGLGVAAVGPVSNGTRDVSVYDLRLTGNVDNLLNTTITPGDAKAIAIYNGLAYVADASRGLQVIRFLAQDIGDTPPTASLSTSAGSTSADEGQLLRVTVDAADDTQVRNVEFFVDGVRVSTDGNFPFEFGLRVPSLDVQTNLRLRARAYDTGGNSTFTPELVIAITPDTAPPVARGTIPRDGALVGQGSLIGLLLNEPLDEATLAEDSLSLLYAGEDGLFGTPDDETIAGGAFSFRDDVLGAFRTFSDPLESGRYRATASVQLTDLRGNPLQSPLTWEFEYFDAEADQDGDGVPDRLEELLGLSATNPDSDGDGTDDGDEDPDGDGLVTRAEVLYQTDVLSPDSDGDSIADGDEDDDEDTLTSRLEFEASTDIYDPDSDDDQFEDGPEVENLSDPLDPTSIPIRVAHAGLTTRNDTPPPLGTAFQELFFQNLRRPELGFGFSEAVIRNTVDPLTQFGKAEGQSVVVENQNQNP